MAYNVYDIGDLVRVSAAFTDENGNPADPDDVTLTILQPDGTVVEKAMVDLGNDETGTWYFEIDTTTDNNDNWGLWYYRFVGTGNVQQTSETAFKLRYSKVLAG